ncbi:MAG: DNA polymerase III subunit beta [Patescibacteria group bacterium]|nr:DNA polymerase III subunit beta [Patescibacteria group bacterium]
MKVSLLQENLAKGVLMVGRVVASKTQLPVLSNILLATEKGKLRVSATNLETGINLWISSKIDKPGKITVPAKVFLELVSSLPKDTIVLETEGERLKVTCGKFKSTINGILAEEFPEVPSLKSGKKKGTKSFKVKTDILEACVDQVAMAAGIDETRPIFTGVKWEISKNIKLAATDGYRLSVKTIKGVRSLEKDLKEMVVPAKALMELTKIISKVDDEEVLVAVTDKEKQLILALKDVEVVTRLIEGEFPDFEKIIPKTSSTTIELDREELIQAVRVAAIFARDSANIVKFKIIGSDLLISANAPQVGENEVKVNIEKKGEETEIAFNSRYLLEILGLVKAERLTLSMSGPLSPGVFKEVSDKDFLHIIMPVRVRG